MMTTTTRPDVRSARTGAPVGFALFQPFARLAALATAFAALVAAASGAVAVRTSPTLPAEGVRISFIPTTSVGRTTAYYKGSDMNYRDLGQSFTVSGSSFDMRAVTWRINGFHANVPGQDFLIRIYRLPAPSTAPNAVTGLVSAQAGTLSSVLTDGDHITFILDEPVTLDAGGHYLVMFGFAGPTSPGGDTEALGFERTDAASGFAGRMWVKNNGSFGSDTKGTTFVIHDELPSTNFVFGAASSLYTVALAPSLASDPEAQAEADRLIDLLGEITGATIVQNNVATSGILLGVADDYPALASAYALDDTAMTGREDYLIYSKTDTLHLVGATKMGLRHAVSDLLHRWGYRRYFPSARWRIVPDAATLELSATSVVRPDFLARNLFITTHDTTAQQQAYEEWRTDNRMGSGFSLNTTHAYNAIYSRNKAVFDANPSYFAKVDGVWQNTASQKKFNAASAGLLALLETDAAAWFTTNPDQDSISMEPSDQGGWDNSGDAYATIGGANNQAVTIANHVASTAAAPLGKYVGMYAYGEHQYIPGITVEPNVIVSFATHLVKSNMAALIDGWIDQGVELIGIRDYGSVYSWTRGLPSGSEGIGLDYAAHYLPVYHGQWGARFYTSEFEHAWASCGPGAYFLARALWDVHASPEAALTDFVTHAFGDASAEMTAFYELIVGSGATHVRSLPFPELYQLLVDALAGVPGDTVVRERIAGLAGYVRYLELYYATRTAPDADVETAIADLYTWVMRMQPWELLPTRRMTRHSLGFSGVFPADKIPTGTELNAMEAAAALAPVTFTELVSLANAGSAASPATTAWTALTPRTQSTTSPRVRQGASFVFPLGASQSVSVSLAHQRFNVSPSAPRYAVIAPDGTVIAQGRLTAEGSTAVAFTTTTAGNYTIMTDPSMGGVRCVSDRGFVMRPEGGRIDLYRPVGTFHIVVPAGTNLQLAVGGYGTTEYVDVQIRDAANTLIDSAADVTGEAPFVVDLPVEATDRTYRIVLSSPASSKFFEDVFIEFKGGYVSPIAINPNLF